jgi:hypothetical protein
VQYLIVLALVSAVVVFVTVPLRQAAADRHPEAGGRPNQGVDLAELEAAREAKYRELRDAELDHRTGKLSDDDYEALDRSLRGEAIEILREIDRATIDQP